MKTKKDKAYSFEHTQHRLKERFGIALTRPEYNSLCGVVGLERADKTEYTAGDVQKFVTRIFKGAVVTFVYSWNRSCITTVLKPIKCGTRFHI